MIKVSLDEHSDGWSFAIETGPTMSGLPSVDAALDGAVKWIEAYDRIERIVVDRIFTLTREGDFWGCELNDWFSSTSPGAVMKMAIELGWLGRDDLYTVRMG